MTEAFSDVVASRFVVEHATKPKHEVNVRFRRIVLRPRRLPLASMVAGLLAAVTLAGCASEPPRAVPPDLARDMTPPVSIPTPVPAARPWTAEPVPVSAQPLPKMAALPAPVAPPPPPPPIASRDTGLRDTGLREAGIASYYWQDQMTASGEKFDRRAMTAAHRTLPMGTRVRVTHMKSGKSVVVRINDRGPFKPGRIIDLSEAAAEQIEMTKNGLAPVSVERAN